MPLGEKGELSLVITDSSLLEGSKMHIKQILDVNLQSQFTSKVPVIAQYCPIACL